MASCYCIKFVFLLGSLMLQRDACTDKCKYVCIYIYMYVHKNSSLCQKCLCILGLNWNRIVLLVFENRGKPHYPDKNLLEHNKERTTTQTTYDTISWNWSGTHWWETITLTLMPSLLPHSMLPEHAYTLWNAGGPGYVAVKTRWLLELDHKARFHCNYM